MDQVLGMSQVSAVLVASCLHICVCLMQSISCPMHLPETMCCYRQFIVLVHSLIFGSLGSLCCLTIHDDL